MVDLSFPVVGDRLPRDHGYLLYGALSRAAPHLHGAAWLGVHPVGGSLLDEKTLQLGPRTELRLRLPAERIGDVLLLGGTQLEVGGAALGLGAPRVHVLEPAASLDARLVVIKLTGAPRRTNAELGRGTLDVTGFADRYAQEIRRQLDGLQIHREFGLCGRGSLTVAGRRVVGYAVRVSGLSADESLALQVKGLGGKRRMGCGLFRASKGP